MDQHVHVLIANREVHPRRGLQALLAAWPQIEVVGAAANGVEVESPDLFSNCLLASTRRVA